MKKFITGLLIWAGVYAFMFIAYKALSGENILFSLIFFIFICAFTVWDIYDTYIKKYLKK